MQLLTWEYSRYCDCLPSVAEVFGSRERLVVNAGSQASSGAATAEMEVS